MNENLYRRGCVVAIAVLMTCFATTAMAKSKGKHKSRVWLKAKLAATDAAPGAEGSANWQSRNGKQTFKAEAENLGGFVGHTLTVLALQNGAPVILGTMTVEGDDDGGDDDGGDDDGDDDHGHDDGGSEGEAELEVRNAPTLNAGDTVQVLDGGVVLLEGVLVSRK